MTLEEKLYVLKLEDALKRLEEKITSDNSARAENWRCGTNDCICNENGVCDCHEYTVPPTSPIA